MSDVVAEAIEDLKRKTMVFFCSESNDVSDPAWIEMNKAERRLWALLTPTITEDDLEAGAYALFCDTARSSSGKLPAWDELAPVIQDPFRRQVRVVLEAVAAARQRATGSGVSADGS